MPVAHVDPFARPGALTPSGAEPTVRLTAIEKYFGSNHVLRGCNLEVYPKETVCLIGRSGSGKSTLLRCTNFLEEPTAGVVEVGDVRLAADPLKSRSRDHREDIRQIRMAAQMVFQEFNLFPHMTVIGNLIEAPIRVGGLKKDRVAKSFGGRAQVGFRCDDMKPGGGLGADPAQKPFAHDALVEAQVCGHR